MDRLGQYIKSHFGLQADFRSLSKEEAGHLPLYLKGNFILQAGHIGGKSVLWAEVRKETEVTPAGLERQGANLRSLFQRPVIFIFDQLDAWQRKRFIERKVAFIQPNRQLYIPELFVDLSDVRSGNVQKPEEKKVLSHPAQCALLYHLQKEPLEGKPFGAVADILRYSPMTVTRIAKELTQFKLAETEGGKEKEIVFLQAGADLWNKALPFLSTPVREAWFCDRNAPNKHLLESGDLALSEYGMLSPSDKRSYALGKEKFRALRKENKLTGLNSQYGDLKIEVWHYEPSLLSKPGGKMVDKLSLYLSFGVQGDERVSAALNELLNTIKW
jgi:hypothetical protein